MNSFINDLFLFLTYSQKVKKLNTVIAGIAACLFISIGASGQGRPIGFWRSHLPYNNVHSIATDGITIYAATNLSMSTNNVVTKEWYQYAKTEGMSDLRTSCIGYDIYSGTAILAYQNGNIDLFRDNSFYNIPDLKRRSVSGSKTIHNIYTENGYAYLSTGIGVIVIDLKNREVKETYIFYQNAQEIETTGFTAAGDYYYVSSVSGLYRTPKSNPNPQIPSSWQLISTGVQLGHIASVGEKVFVSGTDSLFVLNNDTLQFIHRTDTTTTNIDGGKDALWIHTFHEENGGIVHKMNMNYDVIGTIHGGRPVALLELPDNSIWIADEYLGLMYYNREEDRLESFNTPGPNWYGAYGIYAENENVWVAHGAYNELYQPQGNRFGISRLTPHGWHSFNSGWFTPFGDSITDFVSITKNPVDNSLWAGSLATGLFILYPDDSHEILYRGSALHRQMLDTNMVSANSITPDEHGNMWITQHMSEKELAVRTKEGKWYHFGTPYQRTLPHSAAGLLIDKAGNKWFHAAHGPAMVIVYDDNNTIENPADDRHRAFGNAENIPGTRVHSMAIDRTGIIWVGTDDGIARISCPEQAFQSNCLPELPKVQYDQFVGHLFMEEQVRTIAVDGANRKWVGTSNGAWLVSPDGDQIIYRFTEENSPLPSNIVHKIAVDGVTGDVYFGTDNGLISFRSTATNGNEAGSTIVSYPNPVPSGYAGTIGIRGLTENADVRITDISGQLVHRTTAHGGQAVWNGRDYTGKRAQSGVYLIFATNSDGSETNTGKIVFME